MILCQHVSIPSVNLIDFVELSSLTCCWSAPRYPEPGSFSVFQRLGRYPVLAHVQNYEYSRIWPNVQDVTKVTSTDVLPNVLVVTKITKPQATSAYIYIRAMSCSTFSHHDLPSCSVSKAFSLSSPQGIRRHFVHLISDLFLWYIHKVHRWHIHYKPVALIISQLCYSMCFNENFSDVLWV